MKQFFIRFIIIMILLVAGGEYIMNNYGYQGWRMFFISFCMFFLVVGGIKIFKELKS